MKKFEGFLLCTDLDGTLLNSDFAVSKENLDAIAYFQREGGLFTFVTGRMPYFAEDVYEVVKPNAPVACCNGGGIYDFRTREYVRTVELSKNVRELVMHVVENVEGVGFQVDTFDRVYFCQENRAMEWFREVTGMPNLVRDYDDVSEPIAKIVFGEDDEDRINAVINLLNSHPLAEQFDFTRSEYSLYEILPKGCNKGMGLERLAEHLNIDMRKTLAVGDYNNDVSMIRAAGVGIAVANAVEEAKACADHITVSNDEHAIARIIYDLEKGAFGI